MTYISPSVKMLTPKYDSATRSSIDELTIETIRRHDHGVIEIGTCFSGFTPSAFDRFPFEKDLFDRNGLLYSVGTSGNPGEESVGSMRFCADMPESAEAFTGLVSDYLPVPDLKVGSYFRMMQYQDGGEHFPHLDTDFDIPGTGTTKYTFLFYINSPCNGSGKLQFIKPDSKVSSDRASKGHIDWERQAEPDELFLEIEPRAGMIVVFPHDLWHGVSRFKAADMSICGYDKYLFERRRAREVIRADLYKPMV